jgi:ankyrin repeat protein
VLGLHNLFNAINGGVDKRHGAAEETRLYQAARSGNLKAVKRLLRQGADPNAKDANGLTPLHQAAFWGETEIVDVLLKAGADPNADNGRGWTALHSAAVSGGNRSRADIIGKLKAAGGDGSLKDKQGWTPQDYMTLWDDNAPAAEKLKKYLQIPNGLASDNGHFRPRPRAFNDAGMPRREQLPALDALIKQNKDPKTPPPSLH